MSDVPVQRAPRTPAEVVAGIGQLRLWGMRRGSAVGASRIARMAEEAGFEGVKIRLCAELVIDPAVDFLKRRLPYVEGFSRSQLAAIRVLMRHIELLRRNGVVDYMLLGARKS